MKELIRLKGKENMGRIFTPHMEYHFDEVTKKKSFRCPGTGENVTAEFVRRAYIYKTPFVDILYCSAFGDCTLTCDKKCLNLPEI